MLAHPRAYFGRVFFPEFVAWVAGLCITGVFLAAYDIPVTFHTVMGIDRSATASRTRSR